MYGLVRNYCNENVKNWRPNHIYNIFMTNAKFYEVCLIYFCLFLEMVDFSLRYKEYKILS